MKFLYSLGVITIDSDGLVLTLGSSIPPHSYRCPSTKPGGVVPVLVVVVVVGLDVVGLR